MVSIMQCLPGWSIQQRDCLYDVGYWDHYKYVWLLSDSRVTRHSYSTCINAHHDVMLRGNLNSCYLSVICETERYIMIKFTPGAHVRSSIVFCVLSVVLAGWKFSFVEVLGVALHNFAPSSHRRRLQPSCFLHAHHSRSPLNQNRKDGTVPP